MRPTTHDRAKARTRPQNTSRASSVTPLSLPTQNNDAWAIALLAAYIALSQAFVGQPSIYTVLQLGMYILVLGILASQALRTSLRLAHPVIAAFALVIVLNLIIRAVLSIITGMSLVERDVLLVPLALIILGFNIRGDLNTRRISIMFGSAAAISSWYAIISYGGLTAHGAYFFPQKNQFGALLGAAIALLLHQLISALLGRYALTSLCIISLVVLNGSALLLLRNRSTLLGLIILLLAILTKTLFSSTVRAPQKVLVVVALALSTLLFGSQSLAALNDAFFAGYDTSDINDVSANRFDVYLASLDFLRKELLLGDLGTKSALFDPHNFVLFHLVRSGLLLSLGHLVIYAFCSWKAISEWSGHDITEVHPWAYLMLVALVGSLLEYSQPFGPGTTQFLTWTLFGYSLNQGGRHL